MGWRRWRTWVRHGSYGCMVIWWYGCMVVRWHGRMVAWVAWRRWWCTVHGARCTVHGARCTARRTMADGTATPRRPVYTGVKGAWTRAMQRSARLRDDSPAAELRYYLRVRRATTPTSSTAPLPLGRRVSPTLALGVCSPCILVGCTLGPSFEPGSGVVCLIRQLVHGLVPVASRGRVLRLHVSRQPLRVPLGRWHFQHARARGTLERRGDSQLAAPHSADTPC